MAACDEFQEPNEPFVCMGIDKITLGIESKYLNYRQSPEQLRGIIDIVNHGNWSELNIQWEYQGVSHIDNNCPLRSVLEALYYGVFNNIFRYPFVQYLYNCLNGIFCGYFKPESFISQFIFTGYFKLDEYEICFDFHDYNPFTKFDRLRFNNFRGTMYTKDHKTKRRPNGENKGTRRSLFCFYNRGAKIQSNSSINRLELRICDDRAKAILEPYDLLLPLHIFIGKHENQIRHLLKRYIPAGSICCDGEYIMQNAPELLKLICM